jgi:hypothetical protein
MKIARAWRGMSSGLGRVEILEKLTERLLWRLPRQVAERHLEVAPPLPQSMLDRAKLYADRETMLHALPKGGTVAEVGVWRGDFSKLIWDICEPVELHLIDVDFAPFNWPAAKASGIKATAPRSCDRSSRGRSTGSISMGTTFTRACARIWRPRTWR